MDRIYSIPLRILVTGSRGKSSVVRLLTAALASYGMNVRGRITGVIPRELFQTEPAKPSRSVKNEPKRDSAVRGFPSSELSWEPFQLKEKLILRSGPTSVEEMRWWLSTLPPKTDAVVLENSAVAPELQPLAFRWLRPHCTVLTNVRSDHEEVWGKGEESAATVLCSGIGREYALSDAGHPVILPRSVAEKETVARLLSEKRCSLLPCDEGFGFVETYLALIEEVCRFFGFDEQQGRIAASMLPPDVADFTLFQEKEGLLAAAFSANDPESTEFLFRSLEWYREETTLLFNARKDRVGRLAAFLPWLRSFPWKRVYITGSRPIIAPFPATYISLPDSAALERFACSKGKVFGCGNVAGVPLEYLLSKRLKNPERRDVVW